MVNVMMGGEEGLFPEITVKQSFKSAAVTCLVLGHLMNRIVNGIKAKLFCQGSKLFLAGTGTVLCSLK